MDEVGEGINISNERKAASAALKMAEMCCDEKYDEKKYETLRGHVRDFWMDVSSQFAQAAKRDKRSPTMQIHRNRYQMETVVEKRGYEEDKKSVDAFFKAVDSITFDERRGSFRVGGKTVDYRGLLKGNGEFSGNGFTGVVRFINMQGQDSGTRVEINKDSLVIIQSETGEEGETQEVSIMTIQKNEKGKGVSAFLSLSGENNDKNVVSVSNDKVYTAIVNGLVFSQESPMVSVETLNEYLDQVQENVTS